MKSLIIIRKYILKQKIKFLINNCKKHVKDYIKILKVKYKENQKKVQNSHF